MGADSGFVVDASIALAWCFEDETTPRTDAILAGLEQQQAIAPAIWPLEIANGLRSAERRGRVDEAKIPTLSRLQLGLSIRIESPVSLASSLGPVLHMARSLGLTAYPCGVPRAGDTAGTAACDSRRTAGALGTGGRHPAGGGLSRMRTERFTQKTSEAIVEAQQLAESEGHAQLEVEHLLLVLVDQPDGVVPAVLERIGSGRGFVRGSHPPAVRHRPAPACTHTRAVVTRYHQN